MHQRHLQAGGIVDPGEAPVDPVQHPRQRNRREPVKVERLRPKLPLHDPQLAIVADAEKPQHQLLVVDQLRIVLDDVGEERRRSTIRTQGRLARHQPERPDRQPVERGSVGRREDHLEPDVTGRFEIVRQVEAEAAFPIADQRGELPALTENRQRNRRVRLDHEFEPASAAITGAAERVEKPVSRKRHHHRRAVAGSHDQIVAFRARHALHVVHDVVHAIGKTSVHGAISSRPATDAGIRRIRGIDEQREA